MDGRTLVLVAVSNPQQPKPKTCSYFTCFYNQVAIRLLISLYQPIPRFVVYIFVASEGSHFLLLIVSIGPLNDNLKQSRAINLYTAS